MNSSTLGTIQKRLKIGTYIASMAIKRKMRSKSPTQPYATDRSPGKLAQLCVRTLRKFIVFLPRSYFYFFRFSFHLPAWHLASCTLFSRMRIKLSRLNFHIVICNYVLRSISFSFPLSRAECNSFFALRFFFSFAFSA